MSTLSLNHEIMKQLMNPSLERDYCEHVFKALDSKTTSEKKQLLNMLKEDMSIFKQKAKNIESPELYQQMCDKIKAKIKECDSLFHVTVSDICSLIENTSIRFTDVGLGHASPIEVCELIEEKVIGQKEYCEALSLIVYEHLLRCKNQATIYPKTNLLVYGPTGVGKTYIVQTLAKRLNIEFQIVNCNTLVQTGIIGLQISNALTYAYLRNRHFTNIIIFFDEFDKLFKDGFHNIRLLQELLAFLDDDGEVTFANKFGNQNVINKKFPTRNITIILGGVFDMLKPIVQKRVFPQKVGFNSPKNLKDYDFYDYVSVIDFAELFNSEELLGRIGQFVRVRPMSKDILLDIIKSETASPIIPFKNYFEEHGMTITLTDDGAEQIVNAVQKKQLGVRGLKSTINAVLKKEMFQVRLHDRKDIVIDQRYVIAHLPDAVA